MSSPQPLNEYDGPDISDEDLFALIDFTRGEGGLKPGDSPDVAAEAGTEASRLMPPPPRPHKVVADPPSAPVPLPPMPQIPGPLASCSMAVPPVVAGGPPPVQATPTAVLQGMFVPQIPSSGRQFATSQPEPGAVWDQVTADDVENMSHSGFGCSDGSPSDVLFGSFSTPEPQPMPSMSTSQTPYAYRPPPSPYDSYDPQPPPTPVIPVSPRPAFVFPPHLDEMKEPRRKQLVTVMQDHTVLHPALPPLDCCNLCMDTYWRYVAARVPVVHQPTFSCNTCDIWLVLPMLALGAITMATRNRSRMDEEDQALLRRFAYDLMGWTRSKLLPIAVGDQPPQLSVAQALLHVELYDKVYAHRTQHGPAESLHQAMVTMLCRGDVFRALPLNSPPPKLPRGMDPATDPVADTSNAETPETPLGLSKAAVRYGPKLVAWWYRWAETEAMHRVVFVALSLDAFHGALFGHAICVQPQEIHLGLPCDDDAWRSTSAHAVRLYYDRTAATSKQQSGRQPKPLLYLDALSEILKGKTVDTNALGYSALMAGLMHRLVELHVFDLVEEDKADESAAAETGWLSNSWTADAHTDKRPRHDTQPPPLRSQPIEHANKAAVSLGAWFTSALAAQDKDMTARAPVLEKLSEAVLSASSPTERGISPSGPIQSTEVLYRFVHMAIHLSLDYCLVIAGASKVRERRISPAYRDQVMAHMTGPWVARPSTRIGLRQACRLLHHIVNDAQEPGKDRLLPNETCPRGWVHYRMAGDNDPHRMWMMYHAAVGIWAFAYARRRGIREGTFVLPAVDPYKPTIRKLELQIQQLQDELEEAKRQQRIWKDEQAEQQYMAMLAVAPPGGVPSAKPLRLSQLSSQDQQVPSVSPTTPRPKRPRSRSQPEIPAQYPVHAQTAQTTQTTPAPLPTALTYGYTHVPLPRMRTPPHRDNSNRSTRRRRAAHTVQTPVPVHIPPLVHDDCDCHSLSRLSMHLAKTAAEPMMTEELVAKLDDWVPDLLAYMHLLLEEAETTLLVEARQRIMDCRVLWDDLTAA